MKILLPIIIAIAPLTVQAQYYNPNYSYPDNVNWAQRQALINAINNLGNQRQQYDGRVKNVFGHNGPMTIDDLRKIQRGFPKVELIDPQTLIELSRPRNSNFPMRTNANFKPTSIRTSSSKGFSLEDIFVFIMFALFGWVLFCVFMFCVELVKVISFKISRLVSK